MKHNGKINWQHNISAKYPRPFFRHDCILDFLCHHASISSPVRSKKRRVEISHLRTQSAIYLMLVVTAALAELASGNDGSLQAACWWRENFGLAHSIFFFSMVWERRKETHICSPEETAFTKLKSRCNWDRHFLP